MVQLFKMLNGFSGFLFLAQQSPPLNSTADTQRHTLPLSQSGQTHPWWHLALIGYEACVYSCEYMPVVELQIRDGSIRLMPLTVQSGIRLMFYTGPQTKNCIVQGGLEDTTKQELASTLTRHVVNLL